MTRPRVILHIGRNKAGSTTIQDACLASLERLAATGIGYGLFGHLWQSRSDLPGWMTFDALARHADAHADRTWLVSNEFMSAWPDAFTEEAARALSGCDVSIVAYIRRYDHWVRSCYAEDTRAGMNRRDIDAYLDHLHPRVSALPNLAGWGRCFGWDHVRVRSLDPADLSDGDLLADFADAIGLRTGLDTVDARNASPGWAALELVRRLTERNATASWHGADRDAVAPLADLIAALDEDRRPAAYLTGEQQAALLALYAHDVAILRTHGQTITAAVTPEPARTVLPAYERLPATLRDRFLAQATSAVFAARHPAAAAAAERLSCTTSAAGKPDRCGEG